MQRALSHRQGLAMAVIAAALAVGVGAAVATGHMIVVLVAALAVTATLGLFRALHEFAANPSIIAYWSVGAAIAFLPLNALRFSPSATYSDVLLLLSIPLVGLALLSRKRIPKLPLWLLVGAILVGISALVVELFPAHNLDATLFFNRNLQTGEQSTATSLELAARLVFALAIVPTVIALAVTNWSQVRGLTNLWLAGVAASCIVAALAAYAGLDLQESITGADYSIAGGGSQAQRFAGLAVHPAALGATIAMASPIVLARMTSPQRAMRYAPLMTLFIAAALVSGSRIGLISIALAGLLVVARQQRARRQVATLAAVGLIATVSLATDLSTVERLSLANGSARASDTDRLGHYTEGLNYFLERPLTGYGFTAVRGAHNIVLQLLTSGGVLALAGFASIMGGVLGLGRSLRQRLPPDLQAEAFGLTLSVLVFLYIGMFSNSIIDRYLYVPAGLLLGMGFVLSYQRDQDPAGRDSLARAVH